ncbi:ATP-dependent helicase [Desulfuromonas acetoxidans]|uniref:DNA 3'-5' helicase n=1 Tax=Desulfuromonas acetoxidans (strain DSM 684 / 11070) TaxID=281689 RepID=Q1K1Y5_DESA6|nr:UvrD-helicase domain-containing protein [Desulfuromonas acetoxidans]EAT16654.1 UvrD/REP helicase [Desulfuromonas acetoxidans DSM 684]MBF0646471.1 UvrD-helicase domain-containing protein [Desulfuromonas acetoxidans]NVD24765.1 UvrD-helicase domain-containing protein [Desulfuromonas acetoxidans]NVE16810.1 UvrD-helicase domain-containing protein [Desulfuromonas acetoxidans]
MDLMQLNEPQRQAVLHTEGALLVLAGAGSGKTRVITCRIGHLLERVPAEQIVALTFTNKAAREMRDRVVEQVGRGKAKGLTISTFHSLGVRILRQEIEQLGYKKNFSIYPTSDQLRLVRDMVQGRQLPSGGNVDPDRILWLISAAKNELVEANDYTANPRDEYEVLTAEIYPRYQKSLKACNAIDFDDILLLTIRLFERFADVLDRYRQQFRYIMVDEYQDTNHVQYHMLRLLSSAHHNLCVVGDDDQSIYGWRGAKPGNILDFGKDFPGARVIKLEQNYRSTGNILAAANALIVHNQDRHGKKLWTAGDAGADVVYRCCDDGEDEAMAVVEVIHRERFRHQYQYRDFAILYRTNGQSRAFEEQLRYENIPYVLIGGQQFFDRKEVKDALAYLKVMANPLDEVNLLRILNYPKRGIGETTAERLIQASVVGECSLWDVLHHSAGIEGIGEKAGEAIQNFIALMERYQRRYRQPGQLVTTTQELFRELQLEEELYRQADDPKKARRRVENLHEVVNAVSSYEEREAIATLESFLEKVSLLDRDEPPRGSKEEKLKQDAVVLMSLHSSKGLEFPCVFLVGMEEGSLPHNKTIEETQDVSEERRLCYVGITRARQQLTLLGAARRKKYGRLQPREVSRFLSEIPESLIFHEKGDRQAAPPEQQEAMASDFFSNIQDMLK